jgi:ATP-dependent Clp protease ATP-binding subunit ClpA
MRKRAGGRGLFSEPEGIAAKAVAAAGLTPEQVYAAVGTGPAPQASNATPAVLLELSLDESIKEALKGTLRSALRLGHNYIGTEHMLLGILSVDRPVTEAFTGLGLSPERAEQLIKAEIAAFQALKPAN